MASEATGGARGAPVVNVGWPTSGPPLALEAEGRGLSETDEVSEAMVPGPTLTDGDQELLASQTAHVPSTSTSANATDDARRTLHERASSFGKSESATRASAHRSTGDSSRARFKRVRYAGGTSAKGFGALSLKACPVRRR
jgi:hypothetical protein